MKRTKHKTNTEKYKTKIKDKKNMRMNRQTDGHIDSQT